MKQIPKDTLSKLNNRRLNFAQRLNDYCRMVLEHSVLHKGDYETPLRNGAQGNATTVLVSFTIPLLDEDFKNELLRWNPLGLRTLNRIASFLLTKHLEVRKW